jgi:hypothetical protein
MIRFVAVSLLASCLVAPLWAQTQPSQSAPLPAASKSTTKKPAPKASAMRQTVPTESGACAVGVIPAIGDLFTVQKIGLTVFGVEYAEVPVPWGLDDLVVARVRAAAAGIPVRRITYAKDAFDAYYHPKPSLFGHSRDELISVVRQIAGNSGCERYLLVMRSDGQFPGTNQKSTGVGVVSRGTSLLSSSWLFVYVSVIVFDGRTFEIHRDPYANFGAVMDKLATDLVKQDEHLRRVDNSEFPASPPEAVNSATLRNGARDLLAERLDKILPAYMRNEAE